MPRFKPDVLELAMDERGLDGFALAVAAKVDKNTVSRARRGKRVTSATMQAITEALTRVPKLDMYTASVRVEPVDDPVRTVKVRVQPGDDAVRLAKVRFS